MTAEELRPLERLLRIYCATHCPDCMLGLPLQIYNHLCGGPCQCVDARRTLASVQIELRGKTDG